MKALIISDIHGSADKLEVVLNTPFEYEHVILVGDLMYHGPRNPILKDYNPQLVADQLNAISKPITAVRGNCDSEVDQMLLIFKMMQDYSQLVIADKTIFVTHGHILEPIEDAESTLADLFISGHTHIPSIDEYQTQTVMNPGSISMPKGGHPATYAILEDQHIKVMTLDHKVYLEGSY